VEQILHRGSARAGWASARRQVPPAGP